MKNSFKAQVRQATVLALSADGLACDPKYLELALKKAEVWMRNAYGEIDWEQFLDECGDVAAQYSECVRAPNDPQTHNRLSQRRGR